MQVRCLIVDDEPLAIDALADLIGKIPDLVIVDRCQDAMEALRVLHREKTDLIFLDIQMPELTGMDMLRSLPHHPAVIFTTAYREFAVEAFEMNGVDYLVKPISLERLLKAINRYYERDKRIPEKGSNTDSNPNGIITIYSDKRTLKINTADILYVEGLKDYALVHTDNGRFVTRQTLKNLEDSLALFDFFRIHRSWIVPYHRLSSWTSYAVFIGDKEIPIGKTYRRKISEYLESIGA